MKRINKSKGFTLIELMVVVAIVAIISAIAFPSYQDQVRKSRRADAKASLLDTAQQLERCMTMNGQYTTANGKTCAVVSGGGALNNTASLRSFYTLSIPALAATSFTLQATPVNADPQCTTFTLTDAGVRGQTGTLGAACW